MHILGFSFKEQPLYPSKHKNHIKSSGWQFFSITFQEDKGSNPLDIRITVGPAAKPLEGTGGRSESAGINRHRVGDEASTELSRSQEPHMKGVAE